MKTRGLLLRSCWAVSGICLSATSFAQSTESDLAPGYRPFRKVEKLLIPDIPDSVLASWHYVDEHITIKPGVSILADYTAFSQDAASVTQVGTQDNKAEFRHIRFSLRGRLHFFFDWTYSISADYKGFGQNDGAGDWSFADTSFSHRLGGKHRELTVGKMKEPVIYEIVSSTSNLPQMERMLSPFSTSRNWGVSVSDAILDERVTWAGGVYNDWLVDGGALDTSGTQVSGRLTWLARWANEGRSFLHLATSVRYNGGDSDILRYRGRPESNVADYYVDTGDLSADHAWHTGFEALWNEGPVSVLAEYVEARILSEASGDPRITGWYLTGSWVLTGETRPYDRIAGQARRVLPTKRWGAPELVVRFSRLDFDDGLVRGGTMDKTYVGLNWWATKRWKAGFGWGRTWLERDGLEGRTDSFLTRLQWIH